MKYFEIAVNYPLRQSVLTYGANQDYLIGSIVNIPLGKRTTTGVILKEVSTPDNIDIKKIKNILELNDEFFSLDENELKLYTWMSDYYHYSLGKLIFESIPKKLKKPRKMERVGEPVKTNLNMAEEQLDIFHKISKTLTKGFSQHLIHGITGSGKSYIYLALIKETLALGKSVHFVLPEINLTPQFTKFFLDALDVPVFVYHSNVTRSEKYSLWKALKENTGPVLAIGVRSSLFLPFQNLGLVIIDEEHDQSFKQDSRCLYNAKDALQKKAYDANIPIVLGSATPSLESYYQYKLNKNYYFLNKRFGTAKLPKIEFVDAKYENENEEIWPLSQTSVNQITEALNQKEQVLVFINKLGFAHFLQCRSCGHRFHCLNCDSNLRVFKNKNKLDCNVCGYSELMPKSCPECGNLKLLNKGFGTEKVSEVLSQHFPNKVIERFDREELTTMKKLEAKLDRFQAGEIDLMVGTQMLSKGHNFEKVNLVVILGVDQQMNFADFRAQERAFQLLKQVSGRAGRFSDQGRVLVETMTPEQPLFKKIKEEKDIDIYDAELEYRKISHTPPFSYIATIYLTSKFRERVIDSANRLAVKMQKTIEENNFEVQILGPAPMVIEKRVNQFSWYLTLKADHRSELHKLLSAIDENSFSNYSVTMKIDVDPIY